MATLTFNLTADGLEEIGNRALNKSTPDDWVLRVFTNDATDAFTTVVGDLTECVDAGYSAQSLANASWTASSSNPDVLFAFNTDHDLVAAGATVVWGFYLTNTAGTVLFGIAKESAAVSLSAGDTYRFTQGVVRFRRV